MSLPKNIVLAITGGIAAYKSAELLRLLVKAGSQVRVVMTESAKAFVQPLTFQALSGHRVYDSVLNDQTDNAMAHIDLAKWAGAVVVAPATAHCVAKLAHGLADDLLSTLVLATVAPVYVAPAMNQQMWRHPQVQKNISCLTEQSVRVLGPDSGEQACGDVGYGRLLSPEAIVAALQADQMPKILSDQHWVITAGPTREAIDPVRYLSNYSSGKMGFALARAAMILGADVTLVAGPCHLDTPTGVRRIDVESALDMHAAVMRAMPSATGLIAAAAVADYRVASKAENKLKKSEGMPELHLVTNPDIVADVSARFSRAFVVGFALETQDVLNYAWQKLDSKGLDMVIANLLEPDTFGGDQHMVTALTSDRKSHPFERQSKQSLAECLWRLIAKRCGALQIGAGLAKESSITSV